MATILPEGEDIRRAVKWISEERQINPGKKIGQLVQEAAMRFDLPPNEEESLIRILRQDQT